MATDNLIQTIEAFEEEYKQASITFDDLATVSVTTIRSGETPITPRIHRIE